MFVKYKNSSIGSFQQMLKEYQIDVEVILTHSNHYLSMQETFFLPTIRLTKSVQNRDSSFILHGVLSRPNEFVINVPLEKKTIKINGVDIALNGLNISVPNETVYCVNSFDSAKETINIGILSSSLSAYLGEEGVDILLKNTSLIRNQAYHSQQFIRTQQEMARYINNLFLYPESYSSQALMDLEDVLYSYIVNLISECIEKDKHYTNRFNKRLAIVNRAMAFVDASSAVHLTIPSILQHAFCSMRTLEYAFQSVLGMSPKRYLVLRRMNLIKKELLLNPEQKIKDIASKYGIVNLGRFSHDFYQLFGQHPKSLMLDKYRTGL